MSTSKGTAPKKGNFFLNFLLFAAWSAFMFAAGHMGGDAVLQKIMEFMGRPGTESVDIDLGQAPPVEPDAVPTGLFQNSATRIDVMSTPSGRLTDIESGVVTGSVMDCDSRRGAETEDGKGTVLCMSPILVRNAAQAPDPFRGWCDASATGPCIKAARVLLAGDGAVLFEKVYVFLGNGLPYFEGPDGVRLDRRASQQKIFFQMYEEEVEGK